MESPQFLRNCTSLGAGVCFAWDTLLTFDAEYRYIWRGSPTVVKWIYLFSRYGAGFGYHLLNAGFLLGPLAVDSVRQKDCQAWVLLHSVTCIVQFAALHFFLAIRTYALYNQDWRLAIILCTTLTIGFTVLTISSVFVALNLRYDNYCIGFDIPRSFGVMGGSMVAMQAFVWNLTALKRRKARYDGWSNVPIMRLVFRDDVFAFAGLIALVSAVQPYAFTMNVAPHIMYTWPLMLITTFTCRFILNLLSLNLENSNQTSAVEFTTVVESVESGTIGPSAVGAVPTSSG